MKTLRYKLVLIVTGMLFCVSSCDDKLELQDPNNTDDKIALSTDKNVKATLLGAYNALSAGAYFGGNTLRNSELLAANDEVVFSGTFNDVSDLYRKEMIAANADATNMWIAAYNTINICNNVLSALDVVNEEDRDQVEGEALFLRGLSYFELVQFYAQPYSAGSVTTNLGVPIVLTPTRGIDESSEIARASVEAVYTQILADLNTAKTKLAEGPTAGKATTESASAILSRVHLQMGNYALARDEANAVINSGNYALTLNYEDAFNGGTTSEDIFDIPVSAVDGVNNMVTFYAAANPYGGRGDIEVQQAHLNLYDPADDRLDLFFEDEGTGDIRVGKWREVFSNVKVVRLAEMYLTRAECNQRLATAVGATPLDDINTIRDRVNLGLLGAVTLSDILAERRIELAHEGVRLHDIKRLQGSIKLGALTFQYNNDFLVFPIPQRERLVNPNLTQNNGYGN